MIESTLNWHFWSAFVVGIYILATESINLDPDSIEKFENRLSLAEFNWKRSKNLKSIKKVDRVGAFWWLIDIKVIFFYHLIKK